MTRVSLVLIAASSLWIAALIATGSHQTHMANCQKIYSLATCQNALK